MSEVRLLVADREADVRATIKTHAALESFTTDEAADGITALKLIRRHDYQIIIMDAHLPELGTWHVCHQIRKSQDTPIIILSRQSDEEDKISFFDIGVDDFIGKPFSSRELMARIHVLLRHSGHSYTPRRLICEGLSIDTVSRVVYVDSEAVTLSPKEYKLLVYLAKNQNQAMSREMILKSVWGPDFYGTDRTVDTHIKTLRENIRPYHGLIGTVWGFGYIFRS
ncbi:MAG: response regulator transcription factor [Eubacteriales bacterium]|nr:response regulator transcription factor [Eubacteriales bacterium]